MLRCAASLVIATYGKVGLVPQDLRALPLEFFTKPIYRVWLVFPLIARWRTPPWRSNSKRLLRRHAGFSQ